MNTPQLDSEDWIEKSAFKKKPTPVDYSISPKLLEEIIEFLEKNRKLKILEPECTCCPIHSKRLG